MCSEVMYGAYYPYLYAGRAGPGRPFYHQYDRFNQDLYPSTGVPLASTSTSASSHSPLLPPALASSSTSSNALHTPSSSTSATVPSLINSLGQRSSNNITKEEDLSLNRSNADAEAIVSGSHNNDSSSCSSGPESPNVQGSENNSGRTQYISATCVVVTHYSGDVASVVDEHFTRALNFNEKNSKESNPMSARNFPPSFWNSNYVPPTPAATHHQMSDLYSTETGLYSTEPWVHNAAHYGTYAAAHAHAYHHNMAQYLRLPQQYGHSSRLHHDQQAAHALESAAAAAYSNYPMSGLEAQVQESSKDLYWF